MYIVNGYGDATFVSSSNSNTMRTTIKHEHIFAAEDERGVGKASTEFIEGEEITIDYFTSQGRVTIYGALVISNNTTSIVVSHNPTDVKRWGESN